MNRIIVELDEELELKKRAIANDRDIEEQREIEAKVKKRR